MDLWAKMEAQAFDACMPVRAMVELTTRCNLKCPHCYNGDRQAALPIIDESPLSAEEVKAFVDELKALGGFRIYFTGGEVLLRDDLEVLVQHAAGHRLFVGLKTNGTLLDVARIERLMVAGVKRFDISVYGPNAEVHDGFTGAPGSHDKTWRAAEQALQAGAEVCLSYCLRRDSAEGVEDVLARAMALGAEINFDPTIHGRHDGDEGPVEWRLEPEALMQLYSGPLKAARPQSRPPSESVKSVQCGCARTSIGLAADGTVYPCMGAPIPAGNIRNQSLATIWRESPTFKKIRGLELQDFKTCVSCEVREHCPRSSGATYLSTGEYTGADPWVCAQATLLATGD